MPKIKTLMSWWLWLTALSCVVMEGLSFTLKVPVPTTRTTISQRTIRYMAAPGIAVATPDEIQAALQNDKTTIVDVRSQEEILATGYLRTSYDGMPHAWVHMQCTPDQAELLKLSATNLIRDKQAPVLIYCGSGKRAAKAKEVLETMGYETVLNGGGWTDVQPYVDI